MEYENNTWIIKPIVLPDVNINEAREVFNSYISNKEFAFLVVFGDSEYAKIIIDFANRIINGSNIYFRSARIIHIKKHSIIMEVLKGLEHEHKVGINLDNHNDIQYLTIKKRKIREVKSVEQDNNHNIRGVIRAMMEAMECMRI